MWIQTLLISLPHLAYSRSPQNWLHVSNEKLQNEDATEDPYVDAAGEATGISDIELG